MTGRLLPTPCPGNPLNPDWEGASNHGFHRLLTKPTGAVPWLGGDWYVWHAPDGLRARAATGLGYVQAGAQKLGVIEASYASAKIGEELGSWTFVVIYSAEFSYSTSGAEIQAPHTTGESSRARRLMHCPSALVCSKAGPTQIPAFETLPHFPLKASGRASSSAVRCYPGKELSQNNVAKNWGFCILLL